MAQAARLSPVKRIQGQHVGTYLNKGAVLFLAGSKNGPDLDNYPCRCEGCCAARFGSPEISAGQGL